MKLKITTAMMLLVLAVPILRARQNAAPSDTSAAKAEHTTYRLEFVLSEFENGKKVNARSYQMMLTEEHNAGTLKIVRSRRESVRVGSRVPIVTGVPTSDGKSASAVQYMDIGVNLDCQLEGSQDDLVLTGNVEVSGISVPPPVGTDALRSNPVVRQSKMSFSSSLTPGKSTTIASVDEVDAPRRMQIDVTATKIK
jgi:hypothetical protein